MTFFPIISYTCKEDLKLEHLKSNLRYITRIIQQSSKFLKKRKKLVSITLSLLEFNHNIGKLKF